MLAIAAIYDYDIWQMDVKTAFLIGFLQEELYKSIQDCSFDIHLPDFINAANANMIPMDLSIATDEKISS